jgi:hypothetical protein
VRWLQPSLIILSVTLAASVDFKLDSVTISPQQWDVLEDVFEVGRYPFQHLSITKSLLNDGDMARLAPMLESNTAIKKVRPRSPH